MKRLHTHSDETTDGKAFVAFIALTVLSKIRVGLKPLLQWTVGRKILCKRFSTKSRNDANMDGTVRLTPLVYLVPSSLGRYARRGVNAAPWMRES